ncbi:tautomerase family protein [uncultured Roseibium sp.]|uniref:tautomerase family protein n=1 Tax=uncultured Roseibium sp. TaxID=1936171 RepID=UPI00261249B5|nr:tautomerase family protein [uncultured Roseibium sp.]
MPIVHVSMCAGQSKTYREAVLDGVYLAMRDALQVPDDDRFMTLTEHAPENFRYGSAFGVERSINVLYITISVFNTRTAEQKAALFQRIAEVLSQNPGVRPEDLFVTVHDLPKENWSVGHGRPFA